MNRLFNARDMLRYWGKEYGRYRRSGVCRWDAFRWAWQAMQHDKFYRNGRVDWLPF